MNKPNVYNFFKFIKTKTGQDLEKVEDKLRLKLLFSPNELDEQDKETLANTYLRFHTNLPKGFPNGNKVGEVSLVGTEITEVPEGLEGVRNLTLNGTFAVKNLPPLHLNELSLHNTNVKEIPEGTKVSVLFLHKSPIESLPYIEDEIRLLVLSGLPIDSLECVKALSIYLQGNLPNLKHLPENLRCDLSLHITDDTDLVELPKGLDVHWNLSLLCEPQFDTLPEDLQVGYTIEVYEMPTHYPEHLKDKIKVIEKKQN